MLASMRVAASGGTMMTMLARWCGLVASLVVAGSCTSPVPTDPDGPIPSASDASNNSNATAETFAVNAVFLGEAPRGGGAVSASAWKEFGYDLDQRTTTATSTDVCTLFTDAVPSVQVDGDEGTDNSWGQHILPIVQTTAVATPSQNVTAQIVAGNSTLEIQVTGLNDDPHQTATGLSAQVFLGASTTTPFWASVDWPVTPSSVNDGVSVASGAVIQFATVYVTDGTVVATASSNPVTIPAALFGVVVPVVIHHPVLTFRHPDASSAVDGVLAGVLDTEEFISTFQAVAGRVSLSLCGPAFTGIANQLRQEQDILSDGTNAPGVPCNAISGGIGFSAVRVMNPTRVGTELPWLTNPCDAGADALADGSAD